MIYCKSYPTFDNIIFRFQQSAKLQSMCNNTYCIPCAEYAFKYYALSPPNHQYRTMYLYLCFITRNAPWNSTDVRLVFWLQQSASQWVYQKICRSNLLNGCNVNRKYFSYHFSVYDMWCSISDARGCHIVLNIKPWVKFYLAFIRKITVNCSWEFSCHVLWNNFSFSFSQRSFCTWRSS